MNKLLTAIVPFLLGTICHAAETKADFYLSPKGSDEWSGNIGGAQR